MVDKIFPTQYTGASPPVASRTATLLCNDGSSSGAVTIASVLALLISTDVTAGTGLLASTAASTYAPLASPALTGTPSAPTATSSDNTTKIATTAFVKAQAYAPLASPTFTGTPAGPTATVGTNTTQVATTAFVQAAMKLAPATYKIIETGSTAQWILLGTFTAAQAGDRCAVKIVSGRAYGSNSAQMQVTEIIFASSDNSTVNGNGFAGSSVWWKWGRQPTAPGSARWVSNAAGILATSYSLFVDADVYSGNNSFYTVEVGNGTWLHVNTGGQTNPGAASSTVLPPTEELSIPSPVMIVGDLTASGTTNTIAGAVLTGAPVAPTATTSDNTTKIATTAFVKAQAYAPLASPTFTGTVVAPTVTPGTDNTTKVATTAFVQSAITSSGTFNAAAVAITGGTIDGTALGSTTASTGAFSSLSATTSIALTAATATTVPVFNGSKQLVSATLGSGLLLSGTTISFAPVNVIVTPVSKSGAYTVLQTDNNGTIYTSDSSTVAYTLPTLNAGTTLEVIQGAGGKITWTAGSGVTVNCPVSGATGTRAQWSAMRFKYLTSTLVVVNGDVS